MAERPDPPDTSSAGMCCIVDNIKYGHEDLVFSSEGSVGIIIIIRGGTHLLFYLFPFVYTV